MFATHGVPRHRRACYVARHLRRATATLCASLLGNVLRLLLGRAFSLRDSYDSLPEHAATISPPISLGTTLTCSGEQARQAFTQCGVTDGGRRTSRSLTTTLASRLPRLFIKPCSISGVRILAAHLLSYLLRRRHRRLLRALTLQHV